MSCISGFQMNDGRWHQTHFVFHSLDPTLLPVVDIYNIPITTPGSHYHLEVGPVCFLWGLQRKSSEHGGMDHHPKMTPSCRRGDRSSLLQPMAKQSKRVQASLQTDPASLCQTPIGLQTQREEARGAGGDNEELRRSSGVLALIASPYGKSFFTLFKKDLHMYAHLEKKRLYATQSLWNIAKWRETKAKLISGHYSNLFLQSVYCVYFFWKYQEFSSVRREELK